MVLRLQPRMDLILELQELAERLRIETSAMRTNIRVQTTNDSNYPVLAESLADGAFSLTGAMSMLGYQGEDIHDAPTVTLMRTTGATIVQSDTRVDPPLVPVAREFGGQAGQMLAPLQHSGEFCGFVAVHGDADPRYWSVADQGHLKAAVADVEALLANAVWFERPAPRRLKQLLLVLGDPVPGREGYDEFRSGADLGKILGTTGWIAARRFVLADAQPSAHATTQRYLSLYELPTDEPAEVLATLRARSDVVNPAGSTSSDGIIALFTPITDRIEST